MNDDDIGISMAPYILNGHEREREREREGYLSVFSYQEDERGIYLFSHTKKMECFFFFPILWCFYFSSIAQFNVSLIYRRYSFVI